MVIVLAVILVVTAVTVMTQDRPPRRLFTVAALGLLALLLCFIAARSLLATV